MDGENNFSFEKLNVYNKAIDFINSVFDISDKFPHKLQNSVS